MRTFQPPNFQTPTASPRSKTTATYPAAHGYKLKTRHQCFFQSSKQDYQTLAAQSTATYNFTSAAEQPEMLSQSYAVKVQYSAAPTSTTLRTPENATFQNQL